MKYCIQRMYGLVRQVETVVLGLPRKCMKKYSKVVVVKKGHSMMDYVLEFNRRIGNSSVLVRM